MIEMYHYFVSFMHNHGYGNCNIDLERKACGLNDIRLVESLISKEKPLARGITVMNFFEWPVEITDDGITMACTTTSEDAPQDLGNE